MTDNGERAMAAKFLNPEKDPGSVRDARRMCNGPRGRYPPSSLANRSRSFNRKRGRTGAPDSVWPEK